MEISLNELIELVGQNQKKVDFFYEKQKELIGKFVVVRSNLAGVFIGKLISISGASVILENSFRLWRWSSVEGIGLSGVAKSGLKKDGSKIDSEAEIQIISNFDELILSNKNAYESVEKGGH